MRAAAEPRGERREGRGFSYATLAAIMQPSYIRRGKIKLVDHRATGYRATGY